MNKYRYTDYYGLTETFDQLYMAAKEGKSFRKLMHIITSENNIKLAFRSIKTNAGSHTVGTDGIAIRDMKDMEIDEYVKAIQTRLANFKPQSVRRIFIPKQNGSKRPLGIPTITDRIIQQAIKQVLEPICEAKFHKHSYGFRSNRSTKHALARVMFLINRTRLYYTIDIDIKGFFDHVNHNKLIKQMYSLGIRDRKLLKIVKEMLKAPIEGEGTSEKGTPQGGILSPLLANIVLNELDWWVSSQWETYPCKRTYNSTQYRLRTMKQTRLKEMYIVRYADDFKIMCRTYNQAYKTFLAVKQWLRERLRLNISEEKSKIINLRRQHSEFLGVRIKAIQKGKRYIAQTGLTDKQKNSIKKNFRDRVKNILKDPSPNTIQKLNIFTMGTHNYFNCATTCAKDFSKIGFQLKRFIDNRLKNVARKTKNRNIHSALIGVYKECQAKLWVIGRIPIYPIHFIRFKKFMCFSQEIGDYTPSGRLKSTKSLKSATDWRINQLATQYIKGRTIQYNDNRLAKASMCQMKCEVTGIDLTTRTLHCHHKIPIHLQGNDEWDNLTIVHQDVHRLIHATDSKTIARYLKQLCLKENEIKKVNKLRSFCQLDSIEIANP